VFSSFAVLAGFALIAYGYLWGDAAAAIAVAVLIAELALRLMARTINALVDRAPEGVAEIIGERIRAVPGVLAAGNVRLRSVGPRHFVEATLQVPRAIGLEQLAYIKQQAASAAQGVLPAPRSRSNRRPFRQRRDSACSGSCLLLCGSAWRCTTSPSSTWGPAWHERSTWKGRRGLPLAKRTESPTG
jgi:divalent metal cation (Fe/Co/Zn/Cd) transporter